eukprot:scaffold34768_cov63-Phaeocystis_antarctica.AAC.1
MHEMRSFRLCGGVATICSVSASSTSHLPSTASPWRSRRRPAPPPPAGRQCYSIVMAIDDCALTMVYDDSTLTVAIVLPCHSTNRHSAIHRHSTVP